MKLNAVKISLVGNGQVGKTTIRTMLEGSDEHPQPTIGIDIGKFSDHELKCAIFDLGGQERFKSLWDDFIKGSSLILLVTDSTRTDIDKAKKILNDLRTKSNGAKIIAIANKQDQSNRLNATQIQKILQVKTYPMIAIEKSRKKALVNIIKENLHE
ncbi:MAG: ADP-ribosylation factor-like protein [Promethearchaeota archaeon]